MKVIHTGDPDIWQATSGGHILVVLFGLPFFLTGLLILSAFTGLGPLAKSAPPWYVLVPFGSVFAAIGLGLIMGRSGIVIDRRRKRIIKWYGLLVPMKRNEYVLDFYGRLSISKEIRSGDKSTTVVYPLRLEGNGQTEDIFFEEPSEYQAARAMAESLAQFLGVPVADRSSGKEITREPDRLNESVRERAQRTGEGISEAAMPQEMRSTVREETDSLFIEIPPVGFTGIQILPLFMSLIFMAFLLLFFVKPLMNTHIPGPMQAVFKACIGLAFVLLPVLFAVSRVRRQARGRCTVVVSSDFLTVESGKKVIRIPADELEELQLAESALPSGITKTPDDRFAIDRSFQRRGSNHWSTSMTEASRATPAGPVLSSLISMVIRTAPGPCILARSDKVSVRFGRGLSKEELRYLYTRIKSKATA